MDTYKTWVQVNHNERLSIRGLYRGYAYPAFTNGIISGVGFHVYETAKKSYGEYGSFIGGVMAGCTTAGLSGYFEYKKITEQLNMKIKFPLSGALTLLMREIPACIFYFPVYDGLRERNISIMTSGGVAGVTCWISSYWADVLNTHAMSGKSLTQTIKTLKIRDYFKGMHIVLPRAFIANAMGYFFYEQSKWLLKN
jgi:hypothetical protein